MRKKKPPGRDDSEVTLSGDLVLIEQPPLPTHSTHHSCIATLASPQRFSNSQGSANASLAITQLLVQQICELSHVQLLPLASLTLARWFSIAAAPAGDRVQEVELQSSH